MVELLVALGIVALLAVLLTAGVQKISSASRAATCSANLRVLGTAAHSYIADHRGYAMPHSSYAFTELNGLERVRKVRWHWMSHLAPYLGDPKVEGQMSPVFVCPSDPTVKQWPKERLYQPSSPGSKEHVLSSYGYNYYYFTKTNSWWSAERGETYPMPQRIANPSSVILLADGRELPNFDVTNPRDPLILPFTKDNWPARRHSKRFNALFFDGHVAAMDDAAAGDTNRYWKP